MTNPQHLTGDNSDKEDLHSWAALVALHAVDPEDQPHVDRLRATHPEFDAMVASFEEDAAHLGSIAAAPAPPSIKAAIFDALDSRDAEVSHDADEDNVRYLRNRNAGSSSQSASSPASTAKSDSSSTSSLHSDGASTGSPHSGGGGRPWMWVAAAAAAIVVGVGLWQTIGTSLDSSRDGDTVAEQAPNTEQPASGQPTVTTLEVAGGEVSLEHQPGSDNGTIRLTNIPAPEAGSAYQMWIVNPDDEVSAGVMEPEDITPKMEAEVKGLSKAQTFMISVEPSGGSDEPSDQEVVSFNLASQ